MNNIVLLIVSFSLLGCSNAFLATPMPIGSLNVLSLTSGSQAVIARKSNNVYSPSLIIQGATLVMYYGGWDVQGQTHDNIYRAECRNSFAACADGALILDAVNLGFEHLNDPSLVVLSQNNFLMYMTGVLAGESGLVETNNHVYVATSNDAIHWSQPSLIAADIWLPSATLDSSGNVILYGNGNATTGDYMIRYNLGPSGLNLSQRTVIQAPKAYANVDVRWRPALGIFQIIAEVNSSSPNQIDYLTSADGVNWTLAADGIIKQTGGAIYVRTPASSPDDESIIYYGQTTNPNNTQNEIMVTKVTLPGASAGSVATPTPLPTPAPAAPAAPAAPVPSPVPTPVATPVATPIPACAASVTNRQYLETAVTFFSGAPPTNANAGACLQKLNSVLTALAALNWPCDSTQSTISYVRTCVALVSAGN